MNTLIIHQVIKNYKKPREPETPKVKKKPEDNNFQTVLDKEVKNARDI